MSKRLDHSLEGLVAAVFKDIAPTYGRASDWERDLKRSLHELGVRGQRFLTIDLPALRKHLDKCLDQGLYVSEGLYLSARVSATTVVPAFLRNLYLQIFDHGGKLRESYNPHAVADIRQLCGILDKLKDRCEEKYIHEEVNNFITIEAELRRPTLCWNADRLNEGSHDFRDVSFADSDVIDNHTSESSMLLDLERISFGRGDAIRLQQVCDVISATFGDLHDERSDRSPELPKHGPGRVSNLRRDESKYSFTSWPAKLDLIFPYDWYACSDLGTCTYQDGLASTYDRKEHPSKLIAVPKTATGPRLIASEPNYHQWIQQLIRNQLESRIKRTPLRHCVSFGDQLPNRKLALQGSIDGYHATVDLKSASDRLSCWTVERAMRGNVSILERIHASRTRMMTNAVNDSFGQIILKKCFTQGSACTFPVQTIIYSMFAIAAVIITDNCRVSSRSITDAARQVRVFGDDLIIPSDALPKLLEILQFVQLKVNLNKTFSKGRFRESCGLDCFGGVDVTPARIKRFSSSPSHETAQSMLESANNLFKRGMWHTADWLMSHLRRYNLPIVKVRGWEQVTGEDSSAIQAFSGSDYSHLKQRWNHQLFRVEASVHRLSSKTSKVLTHSANDLTEYLYTARQPGVLQHLDPVMGSLGVVDKQASVMKRGWVPIPDGIHSTIDRRLKRA